MNEYIFLRIYMKKIFFKKLFHIFKAKFQLRIYKYKPVKDLKVTCQFYTLNGGCHMAQITIPFYFCKVICTVLKKSPEVCTVLRMQC